MPLASLPGSGLSPKFCILVLHVDAIPFTILKTNGRMVGVQGLGGEQKLPLGIVMDFLLLLNII